ncbi:MAG: c-type cytochrome, partial [Myxococcales bacterium]
NAGAGSLSPPTAELQYVTGSGWLSASVTGAPPSFTLTVAPATGGLAVGEYTANVIVGSAGAAGSPAAVAVELSVVATAPQLVVAPAALAFLSVFATAPPPQVVSIAGSGGPLPPVSVSIVYDGSVVDWLSTLPVPGSEPSIALQINPFNLLPGVYTASVVVEAPGSVGSPAGVGVRLQVTGPTGSTCPPGATLRYLGGGDGVTEPADFGRTFFGNYCTACHASSLIGAARNGAPPSLNFDALPDIRAQAFWIDIVAAKGPAGTFPGMPPPIATAFPSDSERTLLGRWIACGAP